MKRAFLFVAFTASIGAQTTVNGGRDYKGTLKASGSLSEVDFSSAGATAPAKAGTLASRPASCKQGQVYFATDVEAGQNLYFCTATGSPGVWTQMSGTAAGATATGPGAPSGACAPPAMYIDTASQDLWFCGATNFWKQSAADVVGVTTAYQSPLQNGPDSTKIITGATHGFATTALLVGVYDDASPRNAIPAGWKVNPANYDVTVTFSGPQSNYYVVINGGVGPQGARGATGPAGPAPSGTGIVRVTSGSAGLAVAGTDYATATNGTTGQALTSNGAGGFGTPATLATVATSGSAADLGTGTLPAERLPGPGVSTKGGVQAQDCTGTGHVLSINSDGTSTCSQDNGLGAATGTGILCWQGGSSGQTCISVGSTAGSSIGYLYPSVAGTAGQVLSDSGVVTCPSDWGAPPTGLAYPTVCHQMAWISWPTFNQNTTGNAATATALNATPTQCDAGYYPSGIDIHGNAQNCTAAGTGTGTGGGGGVLAMPTFSPTGGSYGSSQSVTISGPPGATICYNTTGSPAGSSGTCSGGSATYSSAITVSATSTLYAIATQSGQTNSGVASAVYTISAPAGAAPVRVNTGSPVSGWSSGQAYDLGFTTGSASGEFLIATVNVRDASIATATLIPSGASPTGCTATSQADATVQQCYWLGVAPGTTGISITYSSNSAHMFVAMEYTGVSGLDASSGSRCLTSSSSTVTSLSCSVVTTAANELIVAGLAGANWDYTPIAASSGTLIMQGDYNNATIYGGLLELAAPTAGSHTPAFSFPGGLGPAMWVITLKP